MFYWKQQKYKNNNYSGVAREQQSSNVYIEELLVDLRVLAKLLQRPGVGREWEKDGTPSCFCTVVCVKTEWMTLFNVFIFNKYLFIFQIEIEHVAQTNIFDTQQEEYIRPICLLLMLCKGYFTKKNHKETKYMLHALVTSTVILPCMTRTKPNQFQ